MAFIYGDRVKETSLSVGIGAMTLGGATAGFQTFASGVGLANETFYGFSPEILSLAPPTPTTW